MVSDCVLLTPTVTFPKLTLAGVTEICACTPVPLSAIVAGEFVALLVIVTLNVVGCPAVRVSGTVIPATLNPAPLSLICEIVTLELPEFVTVTFCVVLVPVAMLPKPSAVGLVVSCSAGATPVPVSATTNGELGELFTSVTLPAMLPAAVGVNPTVNVEVPPGATLIGIVKPVKLKPLPASAACVTLRFAVPVFLIVSACVLLAPTMTLPKLALAGLTEICGCVPVPLNAIVAGEFVALLTTLRLPVALPALAGAKPTVSVKLCPAARSPAPEQPLTVNPAPLMAACEMVTLPVPLFVTVIVCEALLPTRALPKLRLLVLAESRYVCAGGAGDTPVPVTATECVELTPS